MRPDIVGVFLGNALGIFGDTSNACAFQANRQISICCAVGIGIPCAGAAVANLDDSFITAFCTVFIFSRIAIDGAFHRFDASIDFSITFGLLAAKLALCTCNIDFPCTVGIAFEHRRFVIVVGIFFAFNGVSFAFFGFDGRLYTSQRSVFF